jgi:hypothetical protein
MTLDDITPGQAVAAIGAAIAVVAAFLPWFTAGVSYGPISLEGGTATGLDDGLGIVTLLIGLSILGVAALAEWVDTGAVVAAGGGIVIVALGVYKFTQFSDVVDPRIGLYLTILGGIVAAIGGGLGYVRDKQSTRSRAALD